MFMFKKEKSTRCIQSSLAEVKQVRMPDNQQERPEYKGWIVGFTDGEGCFSASVFRNKTSTLGWQIFPEFVLTQGISSRSALEEVQTFFGCGKIYINRRKDNHREDLLRFCVRARNDLMERIIPFFEEHPLRTKKQQDFEMFKKVVCMMNRKIHLTQTGFDQIKEIVSKMNQ